MFLFERSHPSVPLLVTIDQDGVGGVTGLAPTVALRDASTVDSWLDFSDNTFKTAGWVTKYASMVEVERGHYVRSFDASAVAAIVAGSVLAAEYRINTATIKADIAELFLFVGTLEELASAANLATATALVVTRAAPGDAMTLTAGERTAIGSAVMAAAVAGHAAGSLGDAVSFLRKLGRNRIAEAPGNPGTLIVYDDDGTTPLISFVLTDYTGAGTSGIPGAPSRRAAGT